MYNILYNIRFNQVRQGGVGNYMKSLTSNLSNDFHIYDTTLKKGASIGEVLPETLFRRLQRSICAIKDGVFLRYILNKGQIDIVHLNPSLTYRAIMRDCYFARKTYKAGIPFVVFFHGGDTDYEKRLERTNGVKRLLASFGKAQRIFVLALQFKNKLVEWGFDESKIIVETTMIEDSLMEDFEITKKLRKKGKDKIRILFLSYIVKTKGIYEAIDSFRILLNKDHNIELIIAGDGLEIKKAKSYIESNNLENIEFKGYVTGKEKKQTYFDSDVYLFPSYTEGMPISVLEAMAFGLPVITRPVGGLKDFFEDGKMGFMTESLEPQVYADYLKELSDNVELRCNMSRYCHEYAMDRFLASRVSKRIENVYLDVINERNKYEGLT